MIKPNKLNIGDIIATISPSSGLAGESNILWRYEQGKKQLQNLGFKIIEMNNTLSSFDDVYKNPQKRAEDIHKALLDPEVKAIIACIGGEESCRILPYINFDIIKNNPKIFIGYSDSTSIHMMFYKAGVVSYYGPNVLVDFAENLGVLNFTWECFQDVLMKNQTTYKYKWRSEWTSERLEWDIINKDTRRKFIKDEGPIIVQGYGIVKGKLIGGCLDSFRTLRGTELYPKLSDFKGSIIFLETSEGYMSPYNFGRELRTMGVMGIFNNCSAIIFGKPQDEKYLYEYIEKIKIIFKEFGLENLPVVCNCNFGHTEPKWTIPIGIEAKLDVDNCILELIETSVI